MSASAQNVDPKARAAARDLGYEGVQAFQSNDFTTAVERLTRAYQVLKVPSLGLWLGRSLAKQGRLLEASELLLDVTRLKIDGGDAKVQLKAQQDATQEREALQPRLSKLVIQVQSKGARAPEVTLDEQAVSQALLGVARPVDPGKHVIVARIGAGKTERREVVLAEGEVGKVSLDLLDENTGAALANDPGPSGNPQGTSNPAPTTNTKVVGGPKSPTAAAPSPEGRPIPNWVGYTALALGGAGIVAGGVFGFNAKTKLTALRNTEGACKANNTCDPDYRDDVKTYNRYRDLSTVGFAVGAVGLVSGAVILWVLPTSKATEKPLSFDARFAANSQQFFVSGSF